MEPILKRRPASLEHAETPLWLEVAEERQVQLESPVRAVTGLGEHVGESDTAGLRDAVGLAASLTLGGFDEPALLQAPERRIERTERNLPETKIAERALQFVAVPRLFTKQSKDGEVEHLPSPMYRFDITISNRYSKRHPERGSRHLRPLTSLR